MIDRSSVVAVERETAKYYDAEEGRDERPLDPRRIAARDRFIGRLQTAGAHGPILEIGTGPGRDALALRGAGLDVRGVDVSAGHAARAASQGISMVVATARSLPFDTGVMGGLWSMSTLMHIPAVAIENAMREIGRVLAPAAPAAIGVWGGPDDEEFSERPAGTPSAPRRLFSRRSEQRWRALLEMVGSIDSFEVWQYVGVDSDAHRYHVAFLTAYS